METKKKLKIMLHAVGGVGHVNACIGLAEQLHARGHDLVYVVEKTCEKMVENRGFRVVLLDISQKFPPKPKNVKTPEPTNDAPKALVNPGEIMAKHMKATGLISAGNSYDKYQRLYEMVTWDKDRVFYTEKLFKEIFEAEKPDVYIQDNMTITPTILYSGIPWVRIVSTTPFFFDIVPEVPPGGSGYPLNGDKKEWAKFQELQHKMYHSKESSELIKLLGFEPYPNDRVIPLNYSLSIYGYPEELSYKDVYKYPDNWVNVESFMRENKAGKFELQDSLKNVSDKYPGKLIYLSLGSMASVDVELMQRFVSILSKTKHRYIFSKGPRHTEFELAENMWGDRYVPQTQILPVVDLVISHGGNNTVTESLANGKPLIIFPMFADQFDNAQRVEEVGFGRRFDPHNFDEHQFTDAIEQLLNDQKVNERLRKMSERILNGNRFQKACERIEALVS